MAAIGGNRRLLEMWTHSPEELDDAQFERVLRLVSHRPSLAYEMAGQKRMPTRGGGSPSRYEVCHDVAYGGTE